MIQSAAAAPPADVLATITRTYSPTVTAVESEPVKILLGSCWERAVTLTAQDPVTLKPGSIQLKLYRPAGLAEHAPDARTVIIIPPTGGETGLDRLDADRLCGNGFQAALVEHWDGDTIAELDLDMHDRGALRSLAAIRHVIEYLKPAGPGKLGILGTSVGAIQSALALGYEPRIGAGMFIVGGGGMSEIIASSSEATLTRLREDRKKAFGYASNPEYLQALQAHIHVEPLDFVGMSGNKKVMMMIATQDITVPTKNQNDLRRAYEDPFVLTHDADHVHTIVYTSTFKFGQVLEFFARSLK
jgi:dienelactone hydrolase